MPEQTCQKSLSEFEDLTERISAMAKTKSVSTVTHKPCRQGKKKRSFKGRRKMKGGGVTTNAIAIDNFGFRAIKKPNITAVSSADVAFGYMTPASSVCSSPRLCYSDIASDDSALSLLLELDVDMDISIDKRCFLEFAIETLQGDGDEIELSPTLLKIVPDAKYLLN